MKIPSYLMTVTLSSLVTASTAGHAHPIQWNATQQTPVTITKPVGLSPQKKTVTLMNVHLSNAQHQRFTTYPSDLFENHSRLAPNTLPKTINLGMNEVPVYDQGSHGTCVTFAATAILDALLYKKETISQLCSLELGSYLSDASYIPFSWDWSFAPVILQQLQDHGVVSKTDQQQKTCAGVREYPVNNEMNTGKPMSLKEFNGMSTDVSQQFTWYSLLADFERLHWTPNSTKDATKVLTKIKRTLATSYPHQDEVRIMISFLVPYDYCDAGACGRYHQTFDTWTMTKAIMNDDNLKFGGHEVVVFGYDDDAIVIDNEGKQHKGILLIRNSWGDNVADNGNYYMSYDFFKQFVLDAQVVTTMHAWDQGSTDV